MSLMSAEGIGVQYGTRRVLQHMDFSIEAGEVVTIVGPNGAGKSVFLRVLIGAEQPSEGRVKRTSGLAIGYVPQRLSIGHTMPMNVARCLALSGSSNAATNQTMLTRVGVSDRAKEQMASLSGGEFQRVLLAYALLGKPQLLILDEPTDGLDPNQKHEVRTLIKNISEDRTILISTHILEEVDAVCTRAMIISEGRVVGYGTPDELMSQSLYRNSVTVSVNAEDHIPLMNDFNKLDFVYSVEHLPEKLQGLVTMRLFPKNKESIVRQLEHYLFSKKIPIEQFVVDRGRMEEVFRELTTNG